MRIVLLLLALFAQQAWAHSMQTAQWRLVQRDAETWDSRLRLPEDFEGRLLTLQPSWPAHCVAPGEPRVQPAAEATIMAWTLRCPGGLAGELGLSDFNVQLIDAVLVVQPLQGAETHVVLSATRPAWTLASPPEPPPVAHYFTLGIEHLLLGPDHLLFVLGLWALWRRERPRIAQLVGTLSAFTLAHSITLAGAALAGWRLPIGAVEACIAASILLLALELASGERGLASRQPAALGFAFGLLHGFGFASALAETGLPPDAQLWALGAFNLGLEAAQIGFVLALTFLAAAARPAARWAPVALCAYGSAAAYWMIERSAAVFA